MPKATITIENVKDELELRQIISRLAALGLQVTVALYEGQVLKIDTAKRPIEIKEAE